MKRRAIIAIAIVGNLAAILYPPYRVSGAGIDVSSGWGFLLGDLASAFGGSIKVYEHLDWKVLTIELLAINLVVVALLALSHKR